MSGHLIYKSRVSPRLYRFAVDEGLLMRRGGSEWLSEAQKHRNRIKCMIITGLILVSLASSIVLTISLAHFIRDRDAWRA